MSSVGEARGLAIRLLEGLPGRWAHVEGVAESAKAVAQGLPDEDLSPLVAAAYLHDIGYAPALNDTGFHSVDGARYLRTIGFDDRVVRLVAHHSAAIVEAEHRGLADVLATEFTREYSDVADSLWYCDMTVGPRGEPMEVDERLCDVLARYGHDHVVSRSIAQASDELIAAVRRTEMRLAKLELVG